LILGELWLKAYPGKKGCKTPISEENLVMVMHAYHTSYVGSFKEEDHSLGLGENLDHIPK
jgi:hypothetical protein